MIFKPIGKMIGNTVLYPPNQPFPKTPVAAVAIVLASVGLLIRTIQVAEEHRSIYRLAGRVIFLSTVIILLMGLTGLSTIPLLAVVVALLLAPVLYGLKLWVELLDAGTNQPVSG